MIGQISGQIRKLALDANGGYAAQRNTQFMQELSAGRAAPSIFCEFCGRGGHTEETCFRLHPPLTPIHTPEWGMGKSGRGRSYSQDTRGDTHSGAGYQQSSQAKQGYFAPRAQFTNPPVQSSAVTATEQPTTKQNADSPSKPQFQEVTELRAANKALKDQNERLSNLAYGTSRPGELIGLTRCSVVSVRPRLSSPPPIRRCIPVN